MSTGEKNKQWTQRLQGVEAPGFTYHSPHASLVLQKAHGSVMWDTEGKSYIDLCAGFGALPLGHHHPVVRDTIAAFATGDTAAPIVHGLGDLFASDSKVRFLETLKNILPPALSHGVLALSGSQAVEIAVKTCLLATGGDTFICFANGYHGVELGVLPLSARQDFREPFARWIHGCQTKRLQWGEEISQMEKICKSHAVAGVIFEPIQGRGGVVLPPAGWLAEVSACARRHNIPVIADEVFTGLGRTGKLFASAGLDIDLICLGKAIGSGFPLSACFGKSSLMQAWSCQEGKEPIHTGTFFGHPFACAVGEKVVQHVCQEQLAARAQDLGARFQNHLRGILPSHVDVRGAGLMIGIDLKKPGAAMQTMEQLLLDGVLAIPAGAAGDILSLSPALNIPEDLLWHAGEKIKEAVQRIA